MTPDPSHPPTRRRALLLGLGLDGAAGERRVSTARDALVLGGSEATHAEMQERVIRFNEELDRRGKSLADVDSADELREILGRAGI